MRRTGLVAVGRFSNPTAFEMAGFVGYKYPTYGRFGIAAQTNLLIRRINRQRRAGDFDVGAFLLHMIAEHFRLTLIAGFFVIRTQNHLVRPIPNIGIRNIDGLGRLAIFDFLRIDRLDNQQAELFFVAEGEVFKQIADVFQGFFILIADGRFVPEKPDKLFQRFF